MTTKEKCVRARLFITAFLALACMGAPARAAVIVFPDVTGNVTLTVVSAFGGFFLPDVRGTVLLADESTSNFLYLTDFGAPVDPNLSLFVVTPSLTDAALVLFNPATLSVGGGSASIDALITGTPTTPEIQGLLGPNRFLFDFLSEIPISSTSSFVQYKLVDVDALRAIPEPGTAILMLGGLLASRLYLRRRFKTNSRLINADGRTSGWARQTRDLRK